MTPEQKRFLEYHEFLHRIYLHNHLKGNTMGNLYGDTFRVGDVVILKSGSPALTIIEINGIGKCKLGYFTTGMVNGTDCYVTIDHIPLDAIELLPLEVTQ